MSRVFGLDCQIRIRFCVAAEMFFERFDFLVCSKFNDTQCGRTCACAVACLCPYNSISNVVVSVTIHYHTNLYVFLRKVATKHDTIVEGLAKSFVKLGFCCRKTNRPIRRLIPSTVFTKRAGVEQVYQVK